MRTPAAGRGRAPPGRPHRPVGRGDHLVAGQPSTRSSSHPVARPRSPTVTSHHRARSPAAPPPRPPALARACRVGREQRAAGRVDVVEPLGRRRRERLGPPLVELAPRTRRPVAAPPRRASPAALRTAVRRRAAGGRATPTATRGRRRSPPAVGARARRRAEPATTTGDDREHRAADGAGRRTAPQRSPDGARHRRGARPAPTTAGAGRGRRPGTWWVSSVRGPRPVRPSSASGTPATGSRTGSGRQACRRSSANAAADPRSCGSAASPRAMTSISSRGRLRRELGAGRAGSPSAATARVSAGVAAFHGAMPVRAWNAAAATPNTSEAGPGAPPRATVGST